MRENIHSTDLVSCFSHFFQTPRQAAVYNIGGSRYSNCLMLEAIDLIEEISGHRVNYTLSDAARSGDHIWWISDVRSLQKDYPQWAYSYDLRTTLAEMIAAATERYDH